MPDASAPAPDPVRTVKYTATATPQENGKPMTLPSTASMNAVDAITDFEFYRLDLPAAGSIPNGTRLVFNFGTSAEFKLTSWNEIFYLAVVPKDPASFKTQPLVVSFEPTPDLTSAGGLVATDGIDITQSGTGGAVPTSAKPEDIAKLVRGAVSTWLAKDENFGKLHQSMPDGGFVFTGPAARLLAKALTDVTPITVWNLSTGPNAIDIHIGRRKAPAPASEKNDRPKPAYASKSSAPPKTDQTGDKPPPTAPAAGDQPPPEQPAPQGEAPSSKTKP